MLGQKRRLHNRGILVHHLSRPTGKDFRSIDCRTLDPDLVTKTNWASTRWPCQDGKTRESIALHSKIGVRLFAPVTLVCTGYACLRSIATVTYQMAACTSYACLQPWGRSSVFSVLYCRGSCIIGVSWFTDSRVELGIGGCPLALEALLDNPTFVKEVDRRGLTTANGRT